MNSDSMNHLQRIVTRYFTLYYKSLVFAIVFSTAITFTDHSTVVSFALTRKIL